MVIMAGTPGRTCRVELPRRGSSIGVQAFEVGRQVGWALDGAQVEAGTGMCVVTMPAMGFCSVSPFIKGCQTDDKQSDFVQIHEAS